MRKGMWLLVFVIAAVAVWWFAGDGRVAAPPASSSDAEDATPEDGGGPALAAAGTDPADAGAAEPPSTGQDPAEEKAEGVRWFGRAIDERGRPVAGAEVIAVMDGRAPVETTTGADGTFRVPLGPRPATTRRGHMRVRKGDLGAEQSLYVPWTWQPNPRPYEIVLRKLRGLVVRVLRDGAPVVGATVAARPGDRAVIPGVPATATTGADGTARLDGLAGDACLVFAHVEGSGRGIAQSALPREGPLEITLPSDRRVRVRVVRADETPVEGARVWLGTQQAMVPPHGAGMLPPLPELRTDARGVVEVGGMPEGYIAVAAFAEGLLPMSNGAFGRPVYIQKDADEVVLTLHPMQTLRFPVAEGIEPPPDGTALGLVRYQPPPEPMAGTPVARMEGGQVVIEGLPPGYDRGHVTSPDGRFALWSAPLKGGSVGEPLTFLPVRTVRVTLTGADGAPAEGETLSLRTQPRGDLGARITDDAGTASFTPCIGTHAHVFWAPHAGGPQLHLGDVGLAVEEPRATYTLGRRIRYELGVRVEGAARLPGSFQLAVEAAPGTGQGRKSTSIWPGSIELDREAATVSFGWLAQPDGEAGWVELHVEGWPTVRVQPKAGADGVYRGTLALERAPVLRVRVKRPEGHRYMLMVERFSEEHDRWLPTTNDAAWRGGRRETEGVHVFAGYAPGRYRVKEHYTQLRTEPFDLRPGGADVDLEIDLTGAEPVRGRVVVPEGERVAFAAVWVDGREEGGASTRNRIVVAADGTFEIPTAPGQEFRVRASHPVLVMKGEPVAARGGDEILVPLVRGPELVFRIVGSDLTTEAPNRQSFPPFHSPIRVRVMAVEAWDESSQRSWMPLARGGVFRLGLPDLESGAAIPERWRVEVTRYGRVPYRTDATAVNGRIDLGEITLGEGATLTVRLFPGAKALPQRLSVRAVRRGAAPYETGAYQIEPGDPPTIVVPALGAGRFEVSIAEMGGMGSRGEPLFEAEVTSDGRTPITLDAKLK